MGEAQCRQRTTSELLEFTRRCLFSFVALGPGQRQLPPSHHQEADKNSRFLEDENKQSSQKHQDRPEGMSLSGLKMVVQVKLGPKRMPSIMEHSAHLSPRAELGDRSVSPVPNSCPGWPMSCVSLARPQSSL